jgi:hypothetical protein
MSRPLVLHHGGCADGFCAAWIVRKILGDGAEYLPVNHGQEPPDVSGRDVTILDFSYRRPVLQEMVARARSLLVLDHHKTAEADLRDCPWAHFDLSHSGARLAWDHFFPGQPRPWLVDYTEDRDLWRWNLPESQAVNAALCSYPMTFPAWDDLARRGHESLIPEGQAILRYQEEEILKATANATYQEVAGYRVPCVNSTTLISEIAGRLAEAPDAPFAACWFERGDGKRIYSLRSRKGGIDVSEVARRMGGGGHPQAAGFEVERVGT